MRITFNWGTGIAAVYTVFALATTGFVTFAMSQRVDLVSSDYYAQSLRQDQRIAAEQQRALARAAAVRRADRLRSGDAFAAIGPGRRRPARLPGIDQRTPRPIGRRRSRSTAPDASSFR